MKTTFLKSLQLAVLVALLGCLGVIRAQADTLIDSATNSYLAGGVVIDSEVWDQGANYLWKYIVTNNTYDPNPGTSNGFAGFELALPFFPPDFGNPTAPSAAWIDNCCSFLPWEWDIMNTGGLGIMPGGRGEFSFTTLPRLITTADAGWFHTWQFDTQTDIIPYGADNAPLAPDSSETGRIPEPGTLWLLGIGGLALVSRLRKKV